MQLVDLVILACTIANPKICHHYHVAFPWSESLRKCTTQAEVRLVPWSNEHPGLRIERWHCAWPNQESEHS